MTSLLSRLKSKGSSRKEPDFKGVVAGSMNFDCNETFYWNQRSRKPKRADFGDRHIKVIFGTRQPHFRVIFLANFLDTRWSQRGATLTNVFRKGVKRAAKGSIFSTKLYLRTGILL